MTSEQLFYDKKTGFDRLTGSDKKNIQSCLLYTSRCV